MCATDRRHPRTLQKSKFLKNTGVLRLGTQNLRTDLLLRPCPCSSADARWTSAKALRQGDGKSRAVADLEV